MQNWHRKLPSGIRAGREFALSRAQFASCCTQTVRALADKCPVGFSKD
jgi:hypothetical protein